MDSGWVLLWVPPTAGPAPTLPFLQEEDVFVRCVSILSNLADLTKKKKKCELDFRGKLHLFFF